MQTYTELEYLGLSRMQKAWYSFLMFWVLLPGRLWKFCKFIGRFFKKCGINIKKDWVDITRTFKYGDWKTKLSYFVLGFSNLAHGQILRGVVFLVFEVVFIVYTAIWGWYWMAKLCLAVPESGSKFAQTATEVGEVCIDITGNGDLVCGEETIYGDNSLQILIYGIASIAVCICLLITWRMNVKQCRMIQENLAANKELATNKDDGMAIIDKKFHVTVMALPLIGILIFTVMPIIVMILIAFTNFDLGHQPPTNIFTWVGWDNWNELFTWGNGSNTFGATFGELLAWTLIWALFATFTNYFLGMAVAILINKKGIKLKKVWRTILVITIAVPQFISLLYISKIFDESGLINGIRLSNGNDGIPFWTGGERFRGLLPRVMVIVINIWVGVPYLMLITTGVLMNIPADLYESAKIDGANAWQMFARITLPYMMFVNGPYLLTSFVSNMNNFNVIYFLTGGGPKILGENAGKTDLLVTWIYSLTVTNSEYYKAAIVGILVFLVVAVISLIVYQILPSNKNEEDFS
ncbi:MAG: sugar ABC transporter permease [Coprobacillus sp.]|nr:sugar ABC transporter permease [Coprobacillus sp.]